MKRFIALSLSLVMMLALCACNGGGGSSDVSYDIPEGKQVPDDAVINVTTVSHASWPYDANWKVWQYIKEGVGGTINVNAIPSADFGTKFPLIMAAPDSLPDLIGFQNKPASLADYCAQGAFLALDDYSEFLPDYNEFWDSLPDDEQWMKDTRKAADGKIYYSPIYGVERSTNIRTWLYRKDIFEKHNLKNPETLDELYEVCKTLKELYPQSYPFSIRSALNNFNVIGSSWKPNFHYTAYYDFENEKWSYGATEDTMREIVEFFKKMVDEGLVPSDFFTISASTWQELVTTDRGFIMPEYQTRIDFFNNLARPTNPDYTIASMMPPRADNGVGVNMVNKHNYSPSGYAVCNTGDEGRIANAFRYLNWFYTDEGAELQSWGKEGETYEIVDGKKKYILSEDESKTVEVLYGFKTIGAHLRVDPESIDQAISAEQAATTDDILGKYTYPELDPTLYIEFTSEEGAQKADYETSLITMVKENIQKFIIGQRPMSEWDAFQADLAELPIDELLAIYETAYNRVK